MRLRLGAVDPRLGGRACGQPSGGRWVQRHAFGQRRVRRFHLRVVDFRDGFVVDFDVDGKAVWFVGDERGGHEREARFERDEVAVFEADRRGEGFDGHCFFGVFEPQRRRHVARTARSVRDEVIRFAVFVFVTEEDKPRADQGEGRGDLDFEVVVIVALERSRVQLIRLERAALPIRRCL